MTAMSGQITITAIRGINLAAKDVGGSSDPYYILKFPNGRVEKGNFVEKTVNPEWSVNFDFDLTGYTSSDMVVVEFYDHDTIGKDEKMGYAMFQLNELYDVAKIITGQEISHAIVGDRGQVSLRVSADVMGSIDADLYSADTARVNRVLELLAKPELQSNTTIFEPNRMGRIVGLASVPNECEAAAFVVLLKRTVAGDVNALRSYSSLLANPASHGVALRTLFLDKPDHVAARAFLVQNGFYQAAAEYFAANPPTPAYDVDSLEREVAILLQATSVNELLPGDGAAQLLGNHPAVLTALENMVLNGAAFNFSPPGRASLHFAIALAYAQKGLVLRSDPARTSAVFQVLFGSQNVPTVVLTAINAYRELSKMNFMFDRNILWANLATLHPDVITGLVLSVSRIELTGAAPDSSAPPPAMPPAPAPLANMPPTDGMMQPMPVPGQAPMPMGDADGKFGISVVLLTGQRVALRVSPGDLIAMVKLQVQSLLNIATANQRLIFSGRQLDDDTSTVASNAIMPDSVIHVAITGGTPAAPAAIPGRPSYVVDYFLPESDDEGNFCAYEVPVAHIVLQQKDKQPFTLTHAVLKVPQYIYCPTKTVAIFMCDTLPDISRTSSYDYVDSADQFFSIPPPEGIHPAVFLDNRSGNQIQTYAAATSRWLGPCRYVYVRLMSSGFPSSSYKTKKHELEFLPLIGTLGPLVGGVDNTILSRVDTRTIVKPGPEPNAEFIDPEQVATQQPQPQPQPGSQGQYSNPSVGGGNDWSRYNPGYTSTSTTYVFNDYRYQNGGYPSDWCYGSTFYPRYYSSGYGWRPYYQPTCYRPYVPNRVYRPAVVDILSGIIRPSNNSVFTPAHSTPAPVSHSSPSVHSYSPAPVSHSSAFTSHSSGFGSPSHSSPSPAHSSPAPVSHSSIFSAPSHSSPSHSSGFGGSPHSASGAGS